MDSVRNSDLVLQQTLAEILDGSYMVQMSYNMLHYYIVASSACKNIKCESELGHAWFDIVLILLSTAAQASPGLPSLCKGSDTNLSHGPLLFRNASSCCKVGR